MPGSQLPLDFGEGIGFEGRCVVASHDVDQGVTNLYREAKRKDVYITTRAQRR